MTDSRIQRAGVAEPGSYRGRSVPRRSASWIVILIASGCATTNLDDPVDRAKLITKHLREGESIMYSLRTETCAANKNRDLEKTVSGMEKARASFQAAVDLAPESNKARRYLGDCLQLLGFEYGFEHERLAQKLREDEARGGRPSASDRARLAEYRQKHREYLEASNREFRFYERFIHARGFPDYGIFDKMRINYELLEDWGNAIDAGRKFMAEAPRGLSPEDREAANRILRQYEQKLLEQQDDDPEL